MHRKTDHTLYRNRHCVTVRNSYKPALPAPYKLLIVTSMLRSMPFGKLKYGGFSEAVRTPVVVMTYNWVR